VTEPAAARTACRDRLLELMRTDPRLVCVDTDTGLFPGAADGRAAAGRRYINLGIAEHTAMAVAAALAAAGWLPYVSTMATFASTRAVEAVKVNIAQNGLPVRIVATHAGVTAGHLGPTHHALEDMAVMRALPNMTVVIPADARAAVSAVEQTTRLDGPVYLRLGRKAAPGLPGDPEPPRIGQIQSLRAGGDVLFVSCGPHPVLASLAAAGQLGRAGISAGVLNAHTLKPFDRHTLLTRAAAAAVVVTVEEHRITGGLGGAVAELLAEHLPRKMLRIGLPETLLPVSGSPEYVLKLHGLDADSITARVIATLEPGLLLEAGLPTRSTS
jgi:transketolase